MLFQANAYDSDAPEGSARSEYIEKKDLRKLAIAGLVLLGLTWPIYNMMKGQALRSICASNFKAMSDALGQYAALHDNCYPPAYVTYRELEPLIDSKGRATTWATLLSGYAKKSAAFTCPAAEDDEHSKTVSAQGESLSLSYGMFTGVSAIPISNIENPDQQIVLAETSNHGARETFNPMPFVDPDGKEVAQDGFLIGYDTDNWLPSRETATVTRLAFPDTANGNFTEKGAARHPTGTHFLLATGSMVTLKPPAAQVRMLAGIPVGLWSRPIRAEEGYVPPGQQR